MGRYPAPFRRRPHGSLPCLRCLCRDPKSSDRSLGEISSHCIWHCCEDQTDWSIRICCNATCSSQHINPYPHSSTLHPRWSIKRKSSRHGICLWTDTWSMLGKPERLASIFDHVEAPQLYQTASHCSTGVPSSRSSWFYPADMCWMDVYGIRARFQAYFSKVVFLHQNYLGRRTVLYIFWTIVMVRTQARGVPQNEEGATFNWTIWFFASSCFMPHGPHSVQYHPRQSQFCVAYWLGLLRHLPKILWICGHEEGLVKIPTGYLVVKVSRRLLWQANGLLCVN